MCLTIFLPFQICISTLIIKLYRSFPAVIPTLPQHNPDRRPFAFRAWATTFQGWWQYALRAFARLLLYSLVNRHFQANNQTIHHKHPPVKPKPLSLEKKENVYVVSDGERTFEVDIQFVSPNAVSILIEGQSYLVYLAREEDKKYLFLEGHQFFFIEFLCHWMLRSMLWWFCSKSLITLLNQSLQFFDRSSKNVKNQVA